MDEWFVGGGDDGPLSIEQNDFGIGKGGDGAEDGETEGVIGACDHGDDRLESLFRLPSADLVCGPPGESSESEAHEEHRHEEGG